MPSLPDTINQANELLDDVLRIVWSDFGGINPALSEPDRQGYIGEEESLRERLKEVEKQESDSWQIQNFFSGWRSSRAVKAEKYLEEAKEFHKRVKDEINKEMRRRASGRGVPPSTLFFDFMGASPPVGRSSGSTEPSFLNERSSAGADSPRHSRFEELPASPSFEGTVRSPAAQMPEDPIFPTAQDANMFGSATARQAPVWQEPEQNNEPVIKTNCISFNRSNATGVTLNNGGTKNSGAVVHTTILPQPASHM